MRPNATVLVLLSLSAAVWAGASAPGPGAPHRTAPVPLADREAPVPRGVDPSRPGSSRAPLAASREARTVPSLSTGVVAPERPRWPADWPSLDAIPVGGPHAGVQTMGSGDIDVEVPGASDPPPDPDEADEDDFEMYVTPGVVPDEGADDAGPEDGTDESLEELGEMIRRRRTGEDEAAPGDDPEPADGDEAGEGPAPDAGPDADDDEEIEFFTPPFPEPAGDLDDLESDDEVARGLEELGEMIRRIRGGDDVPDPFQGPVPGDGGADGRAADEPVDEAPADEPPDAPPDPAAVPSDPPPSTGYVVVGPGGRPLESVVLGEAFHLELHVRPEEAGIEGRVGGHREFRHLDVTIRSADGYEETVRLHRRDEPTAEGLVRFTTDEPLSVGGEWGNMDYPGTLDDLGLDLSETEGTHVLRIRVPGVADGITGGFTTLTLYGDRIQQGIAEIGQALEVIDDQLRVERTVLDGLLADAEAQGLDDVAETLGRALRRNADQRQVADAARRILENERLPIYQFTLARTLLDHLVTIGPNGLELRETSPLVSGHGTRRFVNDLLFYARKRLDEQYGSTRVIVPQAAMGVVGAYVTGMYSTFAHLSLGAPIVTLLYGHDEFGREASRGWAAVQIGAELAMIVLPGKVIDYLANGELVPSIDIRVPRFGNSGSGYAPIRSRSGDLPGPAGRAAGDVPTAPRGRRGLDAEAVRDWRTRENPTSREGIADFDEKIASMDEAVATARQNGVPDEVIDGVLAQAAENPSLGTAEPFVTQRLEWEIATRNGERVVLSADEARQLSFEASAPDAAATGAHLRGATVADKVVLESVISKSHLEANGKPQRWTVEEIEYGRDVTRRLEAGEDLSTWKTVDLDEGSGLRPLFGSDDLGAIRSTFTDRPLRIVTEVPSSPGRGAGRAGAVAEDGVSTQVGPPARTPDVAGPARRVDPGAVTEPAGPRTERLTPAERAGADPRAPTERIGGAADAPPTAPAGRPVTVLDPVADPAALGGPSGRPGADRVEVVVRSRGGSTGEGVLEAFFVNHGDAPVRIRGTGLVLEPADLTEENRARVAEILDAASSGKRLSPPGGEDREARSGVRTGAGPMPLPAGWRGASVVRVVLEGYCLELAEGVPTEGTVFRIADASTQADHASLRAILESSRALHERGRLHPDVDPETYHHSIRQWAIWVDENGFDRAGFEEAFVAHARRNLEAAGRAWDERTEGVVRSLAPGRWRDVVAVLTGAGLPPAGDGS